MGFHMYGSSFSATRLLLLFFPLLSVEGEFHVVGPHRPITAAPGDDVILPCHVEPKFNVVDLTVEWSKPNLQPDPTFSHNQDEYVHLHRHNCEVLDMKIPSYMGRTALFTDGLREGNISLKITNVTHEDAGTYRCFIFPLESQTRAATVHLIVGKTTTATSVHPTSLPTPDQNKEMNVKGGLFHRSRVIPLVICVAVLLFAAFCTYSLAVSKHPKTARERLPV